MFSVKSIPVILFLTFINLQVSYSNINLGIRISYDTHVLKDINEMTSSVIQHYHSNGINVKEFNKFPSYFGYQFDFIFHENKTESIGILAGFSSTGSTIHYKDYSGELRDDFILSRYIMGVLAENKLYVHKKFQFFLCVQVYAVHSIFEIESYLEIFDQSTSEKREFKKWGCNIEPSICLRLNKHSCILILGIGYELDIYHQSIGMDDTGNNIRPSWRGIKGIVSLRYRL